MTALRSWEQAVTRRGDDLIHREIRSGTSRLPTIGERLDPAAQLVPDSVMVEADPWRLCERCWPRGGAISPEGFE